MWWIWRIVALLRFLLRWIDFVKLWLQTCFRVILTSSETLQMCSWRFMILGHLTFDGYTLPSMRIWLVSVQGCRYEGYLSMIGSSPRSLFLHVSICGQAPGTEAIKEGFPSMQVWQIIYIFIFWSFIYTSEIMVKSIHQIISWATFFLITERFC